MAPQGAPQKKRARKRQINWGSFFASRTQPPKVAAEAEENTPVAAHVFSGKFLLILCALAFIVVLSWLPVRTFLSQQAEINQVKQNIDQLSQENADLQTQLSWWKDDTYVQQQAKSRLFYVKEGETPYMVTGTDISDSMADDTSAAAKTAPEQSWTATMWTSFQVASQDPSQQNESSSAPVPSPSTEPTPAVSNR